VFGPAVNGTRLGTLTVTLKNSGSGLAAPATFTVSTAAGSPMGTVTNYANGDGGIQRCGFLLRGLSDDGRYVAIGPCSTDPSRNLGANYLFDTVTGKHVKLPLTAVDPSGW
jgi:hypothetical protein